LSQEKLLLAGFALFFGALPTLGQSSDFILPGPKPPAASREAERLVGIYSGEDPKRSNVLLERNGKLFLRDDRGKDWDFDVHGESVLLPSEGAKLFSHTISRNGMGKATSFCHLNFCYVRSDPGARSEQADHLTPSRPIEDLRREALASAPPVEKGPFRKPDLVELATLDPAVHLDIRYATTNDFLGV